MNEQEQIVEVNYNKEFYVVQANELVRSSQDELNLLEAKLIRLAITQVLKDDTDFRTYSCSLADLSRFLGISRQDVYRDAQNIAKDLMKKSIYIKQPGKDRKGRDNYKLFHWVDSIEYLNGIITFKLSNDLKPYLTGLSDIFTQYQYDAIIDLPTTYSIRLYELMASYRNMAIRGLNVASNYTDIPIAKDEFIFTVGYLRHYFNCEDKYPNTSDFIRWVIDASVKAINSNISSCMQLNYRKVSKGGRSIKYIVISIDHFDMPPELEAMQQRVRESMKRLKGE